MGVVKTRVYPPYSLPIPADCLKPPPKPLPFWWCTPYQRYLLDMSFSPKDLSDEELDWIDKNFTPLMARSATQRILRLIAVWKINSAKRHPELHKKLNHLALSTFFGNSKIIHRQIELLKFLEAKNIPNLLIKGAALIKEIPEAVHYRQIGDIDFFVPEKHVPLLFDQFQNSNYRHDKSFLFGKHFSTIESLLPFRHSMDIFDTTSKVGLDLHWHLCPQAPTTKFDKIFGSNQRMSVSAVGNKTLDPSAMIFLTMIHSLGDRWNPPLSHWSIDVLMLVKKHQNSLDWKRLLWLARKTQYVSFLKLGLDFLNEISPGAIPEQTRKNAKKLRPSILEKIDIFLLTLMRRDNYLSEMSRFVMGLFRRDFLKAIAYQPKIIIKYIYYTSKTDDLTVIKNNFLRYKKIALIPALRRTLSKATPTPPNRCLIEI